MKRGRRKGGSKDKVFGCDLMEHLAATNQEIPHVLRSCSIFIEEHGIVDGIYRLSGVSSNTQKLRSEFDSEGSPDLYKEVYLQDIHCVSSLCKAYFRELPNPLLTYQLYDHFAEAVAVQLEDERLVKIKEVLKELPEPHFRTLEYLMRHLVRMAKYSNETNMHARNLAIVWAPNLLRSKDIEASGFNGTAAFMEVRVQSIVVEFILTHVAQLFPELDPEPGSTSERRKSLPSPCLLPNQDDTFFKALPFQYPGNMSPGDGPPKMRPYHAIIDGTDKRKGSLKGRKWKSIFNLGGRLHDPRKKKYAPKEKEKTALRPAKSMDSLSSGPYTQEDSKHGSPQLSPLAIPSGTAESGPAGGGSVASGYAVTYRRTGGASVSMVSGGGGAQGTYRSLDPGYGANTDKSQTPSQVTQSRAERRAGMHISGPFSVTVPLHITSGLALGVLQGKRAEEEEPRQGQNEEEQPKKDKQENAEEKETELDDGNVQIDKETGSLNDNNEKKTDIISEGDGEKEVQREDSELEEARPKEKEESTDKGKEDQYLSEEEASNEVQHATDRPSLSEDIDGEDYMVMKGGVIQGPEEDGGQNESPTLLSQEEEHPDHELPLDFQDTFGFLDLMDMPTSNQLNEFSVEPSLDLSPLPLETENVNVDKKNEYSSTENDGEYKSGSEKLGNTNEPTQEENRKMERTDSKEETSTCSQKDSHSSEDENQEDTYFGPDPPSIIVELSNSETVETSCTTDPVINEEPASSNDQQESTDSCVDITESETIIEVKNPELQTIQNKTETDELSVEAEIILHTNMQEQTDGNELEGVVLSEEREVCEKGEDERNARETEEKTIIKGNSMESEHTEGEKNDEGPTNEVDVDKMGKESNIYPQVEQTYLQNEMEDGDVEKQKEGSDSGEENDQQMEEDDVEEEIEAQKDCHLESIAELKEGSVPEELSEEDDQLSEDGKEQQSEKEKDSMREEKHEDPYESDREKPVRPPRKKDGGRGAEPGLPVCRTVIISKQKTYQVKAVPVVPPKPQHSKITAFRQQFQQRDTERQPKPIPPTCTERQQSDRELPKKENENEENRHAEIGDLAENHDCQNTEQEKGTGTDQETQEENKAGQVKKQLKDTKSCQGLEEVIEQDKEEQKQRRGTWDGGSLKKDGQKELDKEAKRTSGISMCFDEAVARATARHRPRKFPRTMSSVDIHSQLASILERFAKGALVEMTKLIDKDSALLRAEIARRQMEVEALLCKLQFAESELRSARQAAASRQSAPNRRSVAVQVTITAALQGCKETHTDTSSVHSSNAKQEDRAESFQIKEERTELMPWENADDIEETRVCWEEERNASNTSGRNDAKPGVIWDSPDLEDFTMRPEASQDTTNTVLGHHSTNASPSPREDNSVHYEYQQTAECDAGQQRLSRLINTNNAALPPVSEQRGDGVGTGEKSSCCASPSKMFNTLKNAHQEHGQAPKA
ncbi:hypothetical protein AMELA_G00215530 [Ameiurus melas]|uniref:Rho-GAP domain-containing protein n=1 Tax=Ameiurus melas TaxID=219545 RepID=A0A7J6A1A4_AMEME|nr:hypothetical protein AMELA_G00215530 [Ameiurus melas]